MTVSKVTETSTELGSVPNQEFLTLILNPRIAFFADILYFSFRVRILGPKFSTFFITWVRVRVIMVYDVTLVCIAYAQTY